MMSEDAMPTKIGTIQKCYQNERPFYEKQRRKEQVSSYANQ